MPEMTEALSTKPEEKEQEEGQDSGTDSEGDDSIPELEETAGTDFLAYYFHLPYFILHCSAFLKCKKSMITKAADIFSLFYLTGGTGARIRFNSTNKVLENLNMFDQCKL